jgi:hypothetical protein
VRGKGGGGDGGHRIASRRGRVSQVRPVNPSPIQERVQATVVQPQPSISPGDYWSSAFVGNRPMLFCCAVLLQTGKDERRRKAHDVYDTLVRYDNKGRDAQKSVAVRENPVCTTSRELAFLQCT